jgi:glycosyltransferase involved in cell wall biosynthesis
MRASIYNPYLDTLGGGERYTLSFALVLAKNGYDVDLEWRDSGIKGTLEKRFGMDLTKINVIPDIKKGNGYDLCFWVSDGSIPLMHARNNILHFQVPFQGVGGRSLLNRMKLFRINKIICNSNFTKRIIDKEFGVESIVIYPPVDTKNIVPKRKENIILFVGRFSQLAQSKHQDVLVKSFKKLVDKNPKDWRLVLAGGVEIGAEDYLAYLDEMVKGYPIEIWKSPDYEKLTDLYGISKIFWSASGFGVDENKNPGKVEHFGITVVEAMAAGAVPIVFNGGGHKEIVEESVSGYLWNSPKELIRKTITLIESNQFHQFRLNSKVKIDQFSLSRFENEVVSSILQK